MKRTFGTLILCMYILLTAGCAVWDTDYPLITPVYPDPTGFLTIKAVDSLSPTFRWKPYPGATSYDLAVWKAVRVGDGYRLGLKVFSENNIPSTDFTLPVQLEYDSAYYWSVKPTGTEAWSTKHLKMSMVAYGQIADSNESEYFILYTPKESKTH